MFDFSSWRRWKGKKHRNARRRKAALHWGIAGAPEILEERQVLAANVVASFIVTQDWGSGLQGQIKLNNTQSTNINNWKLEFDYAAKITDIWDAKIVSHVGNHYVLSNAGWNRTLAAGGSVSFGFVAAPGGTPNKPTNYLIDGMPLDGTTPPQPVITPTISVGDVSVTEGNSGTIAAAFKVSLSGPSTTAVTVAYSTADGTAQSGSDYTSYSGKLTFAPGETSKTVSVSVTGDMLVESDETFSLKLSNPTGATIARTQATGTIRNDDTPPTPSTPPVSGDFQFSITSDWGSGFTGQIIIRNNAATKLSNWQLSFDLTGQITSIWDASIVSHVGTRYVITGAGWNSEIAAGGMVSFGFNGSPGGFTVGPTNYALTGTPTGGPAQPVPAAAANWPAHFSAPYVDMGLYPVYDLVSAAKNQGIKYFTLAFITADPNKQPAWGGFESYGLNGGEYDVQMRTQITELRKLGGDVMVSFGGASGSELAEKVTDVNALKAAYQKVIDTYNLTHIDFDIEGAAVADHASIDRRSQALAALQSDAAAAGRDLQIWLTLPVLPTGLTADGLYVVQSAVRYGVKLAGVNVMAMDYGDSAAPNPNGKMGDYAIQAANSTFNQLKSVYGTLKSDAQLWQMIGVTPMIGMNDIQSEVFDQQEARELLAFAQQKGIGRISFWSLNRDKQSAQGKINYVDLTSSSLIQNPYEFSLIFQAING